MRGIMVLPQKVAADLADKARSGQGRHVGGDVYEFAIGNIVSCLMSTDPPFGHQYRDPAKAKEIREATAPEDGK